MKKYVFESANGYTVEVSIAGEYHGAFAKDLDVSYARDTERGHIGNDKFFEETDDADEVIQWLIDEGVKFAAYSSLRFNRAYIQSVLIEREITEQQLLNEAGDWTEEDSRERLVPFFEKLEEAIKGR